MMERRSRDQGPTQQEMIDFLVDLQFPPPATLNGKPVHISLARKIRRSPSNRVEIGPDQPKGAEIREHLVALGTEQISELYGAEKSRVRAAAAQRLQQEEDQRRRDFDQRMFLNHQPDFEHWVRRLWNPDQATALLLGVDPRKVSWEKVRPFVEVSAFARRYRDLRDIVNAATRAKDIPWFGAVEMRPLDVLGWALRLKLSILPNLSGALDALPPDASAASPATSAAEGVVLKRVPDAALSRWFWPWSLAYVHEHDQLPALRFALKAARQQFRSYTVTEPQVDSLWKELFQPFVETDHRFGQRGRRAILVSSVPNCRELLSAIAEKTIPNK